VGDDRSGASTSARTAARKGVGTWEKEFDDIARAFSGAFLFGTPLLFTMEMWWIGTYTELWRLLVFLVLGLAVNVMLAYLSGFKNEGESSWGDALRQAIEAVAVGVVGSTVMLLVLNRIAYDDPLDSILGKIVLQSIPLSIGASAANALLNRDGGGSRGEASNGVKEKLEQETRTKGEFLRETMRDLGAQIAGGIFIGFSIAPTEEVPMLATQLHTGHRLALIAFTLVITYLLVFESGFSRTAASDERGPFQHPLTETALAYVVSLLLAFVSLLLFEQIELTEPLPDIVAKVLVLGMPTAIGGAAGRALLGGAIGGGSGKNE
jgi:putative integral membrane protein (TIGR02587 family)